MKLKYFNNLDGLRAIAAFGVIIAHFFSVERIPAYPALIKIAQQGNSGVSLFFVLSGFVITRILLNTVNEKKYFYNFYGRRTLRIFPLYYFSLLCYNYLPYLLHIQPALGDFGKQLYHYFYLQNFARTFNWDHQGPGHFWSLAVEEHFYLMWPALVYFAFTVNKNRLMYVSVFLIFFSLVLRYIMLKDNFEINVFTFTRLDQLALGCILAILEYKGLLAAKYNKLFLALFITGATLLVYFGTLNDFYQNLFKHNAYGLLYFGLIAFCVTSRQSSLLNKFLTLPVMQFLGKISYGLYVWHMLALVLLEYYFKSINIIVDFSFLCLITVLISTLSYYLLENKFLRLKKYFK